MEEPYKRKITITVGGNGFFVEGSEETVVFDQEDGPKTTNDYNPALLKLINYLLYEELDDFNGNKWGGERIETKLEEGSHYEQPSTSQTTIEAIEAARGENNGL